MAICRQIGPSRRTRRLTAAGVRGTADRVAALATVFLLVAAGCGSGGASGAGNSGRRIAIVLPDSAPGFPQQIGCGARLEGERLGYDVSTPQAPPVLDVAQQAQVLESVLATKPDGLIYDAADGKAGSNAIKASVRDGLPVVAADTELADSSLVRSFVSSSHVEGGELAAKLMSDQIGGSGEVAIIGVIPSHPITQGRVKGFEQGAAKLPGLNVTETLYPDFDPTKIAATTSALLEKRPDLKGIYTTNDTIAGGVASALRAAHKTGKVKVVTWDLQPAGIKLLQDGDVTGTIVQQPRELGKLAMQQLANALEGKPVEKQVNAPLTTATSDNINDPEIKKLYYVGDC